MIKNTFKLLSFLLIAIFFVSCGANKYEASDFKQRTQNHKTIAILPPVITYNSSIRVNNPQEQIEQERTYFHNELYNRLLKLKTGNKPIYIHFQDINITNEILQENLIGNERLKTISTTELAKLLSVDAVLFTSISKNLKVDNSLIGIYQTGKEISDILGKTSETTEDLSELSLGKISVSSSILNAADGYLLWRDQNEFNVTPEFRFEQMTNQYVYICGRNFPYRQ